MFIMTLSFLRCFDTAGLASELHPAHKTMLAVPSIFRETSGTQTYWWWLEKWLVQIKPRNVAAVIN